MFWFINTFSNREEAMIISQPCTNLETMPKATLLAMLPSYPDTSKAIVVETGEILNLANYEQNIIKHNINNGTWVYYESLLPRRMFLTNPNWTIVSFDAMSRNVCVDIFAISGKRRLNFTLQPLTY